MTDPQIPSVDFELFLTSPQQYAGCLRDTEAFLGLLELRRVFDSIELERVVKLGRKSFEQGRCRELVCYQEHDWFLRNLHIDFSMDSDIV